MNQTLKAHKLGVLPLERRAILINQIADQIVDEGDIDFLIEDDQFDDFLTLDERGMLLQLAKTDLVESLSSLIKAEASSWQEGWDPDDWFELLRDSIKTLQKLFPDDYLVREKSLEAQDQIDEQIGYLRDRIGEEDNIIADKHEAGNALAASGARSIFDDLIS